jgi:hypothetical protein
LLKWTVGCGLVALPIALITFFALLKVGGFRWKWKHAKYFRALTGLLIVLITVSFGALIGLNEGVYRGLRDVVNSAKLKEELRPVGGPGADVVGALYIIVARTPTEALTAALKEEQERLEKKTQADPADVPEEDETPVEDPKSEEEGPPSESEKGPAMLALEERVRTDLDAFHQGEWDVNVAELKAKAKEVKKQIFDVVLSGIKDRMRKEFPSLKEGHDAKILDWFVDTFGEALIDKLIADELERAKLKGPIQMIWEGLEAEAKASGNPDTLSYDTLCGYLPSRVLYACAVYPTKLAIRGNQYGLALIWAVTIAVFVILFQLTEFCRGRNLHGRTWAWIKVKTGRAPAPVEPIITPPPQDDKTERTAEHE